MARLAREIKMPVEPCREGGSPGYRWGKEGKCYTYKSGDKASREAAHKKAAKQGQAIELQKQREGKPSEFDK